MTREETIENLKMIRVAFVLPVTKEQRKLIDDTFEKAIKALSQEPCDDAISRILKRMWNCRGKHTTSIDKVKMEQIIRDELPSATQKPIECEDAVSREAVLQAVSEGCFELRGVYGDCEELINALPSVTQK